MNRETTVNILWTGGWDSTYRMVELARKDVTVQPFYVLNPARRSNEKEVEAMARITEILNDDVRFSAKILPAKVVRIEDIPPNDEVTKAFNELAEKVELGPQYEWLGRLSRIIPDIELCIEKAPEGRLVSRDVILEGSEAAAKLFGWFRLPIFDITEQEMVANIKAWGCEDIMKNIWFCNHPLYSGEPCGMCHPCCIKISSGMDFLLPASAIARNSEMRRIETEQGADAAKNYRISFWEKNGILIE